MRIRLPVLSSTNTFLIDSLLVTTILLVNYFLLISLNLFELRPRMQGWRMRKADRRERKRKSDVKYKSSTYTCLPAT